MLWCHTCIFLEMEIFFISKKNTSVGSSAFQKNLQRLDQPTLVIFLEMKKFWFQKKITTMGSKHHLNPIVVFFFEIKIFSFSKKITSVGWSSRCKFFWNGLDPTLVIFLTFFEKKYKPCPFGLKSPVHLVWDLGTLHLIQHL